jgi:hypothetical protein
LLVLCGWERDERGGGRLASLTGRVEGVPEGDEGLETDHGNYTTPFMILVKLL